MSVKIRDLFFDRTAVMKATKTGVRSVLSRFGAFVRQHAKTSMRYRKKPSTPGNPPNAHTGDLRERIYFSYDENLETVVIGPVPTNQVFFNKDGAPVRGTVPEILERGGEINIFEVRMPSGWTRADLRSRRRLAGRPTRMRKVTIAARPYMGPAFEAEKQNIPSMWADSIK